MTVSRPRMLAALGASAISAISSSGEGALWGWPSEPHPADTDTATEEIPWNDLMRRHGRRVVVTLLARGIALERAKELAQDAWMRVIARHRAGLIRELTVPGLIITQASFLARDDLRREDRRAQLDRPRQQSAQTTALDLEQQLDARQQLRRIRTVLDRASPGAQRVFTLLYGENAMTPSEVAAEVGLSVQRVRQIVCELRQRIRDELTQPRRTER